MGGAHGQHDMHADQRQHDDQDVRQQLDEVPGEGALIQCGGNGLERQQHDGDDHGRQNHEEVGLKLILHFHLLGTGGSDGGIRDEGHVVAEHGAAHHDAAYQRHIHAGLVGDLNADGHQGGNGTHGSTHGEAQHAADEEQAGQNHVGGQHLQAQVGHGGNGAHAIGDSVENTGLQEDKEHQNQGVITAALAEHGNNPIKVERSFFLLGHAESKREDDSNENAHIQGHRARIPGHCSGDDIQYDEDQQGHQAQEISLILVILHNNLLSCVLRLRMVANSLIRSRSRVGASPLMSFILAMNKYYNKY